jgi:hypothetical protein
VNDSFFLNAEGSCTDLHMLNIISCNMNDYARNFRSAFELKVKRMWLTFLKKGITILLSDAYSLLFYYLAESFISL